MRLIIASCLLFALSTAQTDCPAIRMYGGICDDPIQVDVVYVLDRDLQGDVVGATTSFGDFDQLKGFMADLLDNFVIDSATNTDKNLAFGMVTVDGNGVYSDGATGGSLSLSSNNFVAGLKAAISTRTLGVGADNDNFLEGINAGLDMLAASQDIGQSQALVVFVDKNTWESANKDTCTTLSDRMTGISLLFIEIGTFNTVGNCFGTATRLPQSSYSDLAVSNEDNEALCGATLLETYFGDYTFDTSAVSTDGVTRYSFALNTRTDAIIWNGGSWEITNDAGSTARGTSDNHPYPPYSLFYGLGIFNRQIILAKCYNPPTLSPTQEPTVEPTDNPTSDSIIVIPNDVQDGQTQFEGICSILEDNDQTCSKLASDCVTAYCRESDNACFLQGKEYGTACTTVARDDTGLDRNVRGVCVDSECVFSVDAGECPDPILSAERTFLSCGNAGFSKTWRFQQGTHCMQTGSSCQDVSAQMSNLVCHTSQTANDAEHEVFQIVYVDTLGTEDETDDECIIGETDDCIIQTAGQYSYKGMDILWTGAVNNGDEVTTRFEIPYTTKNLTPKVICPSAGTGFCRGTVTCDMIGPEPCGRVVETCDGTYPPTTNPTLDPTKEPSVEPTLPPTQDPTTSTTTTTKEPTTSPTTGPTVSPTLPPTVEPTLEPTNNPTSMPSDGPTPDIAASAHGDPIIWTFHGDCYDLSADGTYLASSHAWFDHNIFISVYNDFMREIQVVNRTTHELMLSINNLGDTINHDYPFHFSMEVKKCELHQNEDCDFNFKEFTFDAQDFEYRVQVLPHDYLDPALKDGEAGVHLDIYPRPFNSFRKEEYSGLYFHNPNPHVLGRCPSE